MYVYKIENMNCKSCLHNITDALNEVDPNIMITGEVPKKLITVKSEKTSAEIETAIKNAGYEAVLQSEPKNEFQ